MTVRVLLFGPEAAAARSDALTMDVPAGSTADAVKAAIAGACPALSPLLPAARLAVNSAFARGDQPINPGDEVALIGLVSGG